MSIADPLRNHRFTQQVGPTLHYLVAGVIVEAFCFKIEYLQAMVAIL